MKIALDLDGVVTNISDGIVSYARDKNIDVNPLQVYDSLTTPSGVDCLEHIFQEYDFWDLLLPVEDSWHCVNDWFSMGYDIIFITARRSKASVDLIHPWLDKWGIMFSDAIICDMEHKYEYVNKLDPLFYVDDNPNEIKIIMQKTNVDAYVMKTWYNEKHVEDMPCIKSLLELGL